MKIGDTIRCITTKVRGTIISSRTSIGGKIITTSFEFGVEWFEKNSHQSYWNLPTSLEVVPFYHREE